MPWPPPEGHVHIHGDHCEIEDNTGGRATEENGNCPDKECRAVSPDDFSRVQLGDRC
jgi:hypothetical protein